MDTGKNPISGIVSTLLTILIVIIAGSTSRAQSPQWGYQTPEGEALLIDRGSCRQKIHHKQSIRRRWQETRSWLKKIVAQSPHSVLARRISWHLQRIQKLEARERNKLRKKLAQHLAPPFVDGFGWRAIELMAEMSTYSQQLTNAWLNMLEELTPQLRKLAFSPRAAKKLLRGVQRYYHGLQLCYQREAKKRKTLVKEIKQQQKEAPPPLLRLPQNPLS